MEGKWVGREMTTTTITLECALEVLHPLPEERLTLQLSWSRDVVGIRPPANAAVSSAEKFIFPIRGVPNSPHLPRSLNVKLFSLAAHDAGVVTELCVGSSFLPTTDLGKRGGVDVLIVNTGNQHQAILHVSWPNADLAALAKVPAEFHDLGDQQYTNELLALLKTPYDRRDFRFNRRQVFHTLSTDNGFLPIVCFPLLATLAPPLSPANVEFLVRGMRIACMLCGVDPTAIGSSADVLEVANELLTLVPKCLVYTPDLTRSADSSKLFHEQWERLWLFPHRALAGYDCEDCAQQSQEVAAVLRRNDPATLPPLLEPICALLRRMTIFTVEGDLEISRNKWSAHCYAVVVDSQYVDYLTRDTPRRQASYIPTLVLEGTSWSQGVWARGRGRAPPPPRSRFRALEALGAKVYESYDPEESPYGPVAQLQTADHRGVMLSLAMIRSGTMGVPLEDLVFHRLEPIDVQVWTRTNPGPQRQALEHELLEMPLSSLPGSTRGAPLPALVPITTDRAVMRWIDWVALEDKDEGNVFAVRVEVTRDGAAFALLSTAG